MLGKLVLHLHHYIPNDGGDDRSGDGGAGDALGEVRVDRGEDEQFFLALTVAKPFHQPKLRNRQPAFPILDPIEDPVDFFDYQRRQLFLITLKTCQIGFFVEMSSTP